MNKVFLGIVLAVCILGMLLVMLNDRIGRKSEPVASLPSTEQSDMQTRSEEIEAAARALEIAEASKALAPPVIEEHSEFRPDAPFANLETPAGRLEQPAAQPALPEASRERREPQLAPATPAKAPQQEPVPQIKPETASEKPAQAAPPARNTQAAQQPAPRPETSPTAKGPRVINKFVVYSREKGATVRIGGASKVDYSSMTLTNPDRIVVDLPGSWKFPANPGVPKNDLVSAVRVGQSGDKTRVVIDLKIPARKVLLVPFKSGDGVDVRVDR